jgi:uncharacterized protein
LIVVSDTSPIRALEFLGLLPLLSELFDRVLVPPAVRDELAFPLAKFLPIDLAKLDFVEVHAPTNQFQVSRFRSTLDQGESEALALAVEWNTDIILVDERRGRIAALKIGKVPLGTLGVLIRAKSQGRISAIRPLIERLDALEFFMSEELKNSALRLAGE